MLNGFILLAFTVIYYLWITRIFYIANILLYTYLIFYMKADAENMHNICKLFSHLTYCFVIFFSTQDNFLRKLTFHSFLLSGA